MTSHLPSPAQLALALAIVKQKPSHLDIKDHILQMRQFIKTKDSTHPSQNDRFFDSVAFWQAAHEKSEAEQTKLLDRIYELEQRNEILAAKAGIGTDGNRVELGNGKRGNTATSGTKTGPRKRMKMLAGGGVQGPGEEYSEEVTASFMRQFYALQKILQKRPTRRSILLAGVTLCKTVEGEVLRVNERDGKGRRSRQAQEHPGAAGVIRIVEYAFQLLCRALGKLSGTEDGHDAGQLTYHLVCLYDAVMKALQKRCEVMAQQETVRSNAKPAKQKTKSLRSREVHTLGRASSGDETATQMAQLLRTMGSSLNISCREHQELLEGFLFILLARVGKILCLFVFQDLQLRPDLYVDPTKLRLPAGLAGVDVNDASLLAAQIESKHLIWLLERMLAVMNSASLSTSEGVNRAGFVSKTKARLQNTLLQAVFGTDQPLFQQSLQRPPEPDVADQPEPEVEKLTPDWFVQEVWRLLGWEMLKTVD